MLNFPVIFAPLTFLGIAFAVSKMRSMMLLDQSDLRWLFVPVLSLWAFLLISFDLDNVFFITLSVAVAPFALILACCEKVPRSS